MILPIALMTPALIAPDVRPEDEARLKAVLAQVREIDKELQSITVNQEKLAKSAAARKDEIASLLLRYPEIKITSASTVQEMYRALYVVRMARAGTVKWIADQQVIDSNIKLCQKLLDLEKTRAEFEAQDDYKRLTLDERIGLRESFDKVIRLSLGDTKCVDGKPVTK